MYGVTEVIKQLEAKGYKANLGVTEEGVFNGRILLPTNKTHIDYVRRVEDDSDPGHQTVIYGISCDKPMVKGVVVSSYGPSSDRVKNRIISQLAD